MDLSTKTVWLVTYDISYPKRLVAVHRIMKGYGSHIQLSVFRCELTAQQLVELRELILSEINSREDQVLFSDLGPATGRGATAIWSLGRSFQPAPPRAIVI